MHRTDAMRVFVRVAELSSFSRAADLLDRPKASVSTAVRELEGWLGTQLLHRTTRRVRMTPDGEAFYARCKDLLGEIDEVEHMFARSPQSLRGRLRVDMSSAPARLFVVPALPDFLRRHPQLALEFSCSDRRVDVVRDGFDCVLRVGTLAGSGLVARPLGQYAIITCASPAYLREHGEPASPDALADHRLIHYVSTFGDRADGWEYWDGGRYRQVRMAGALTVNNVDVYRDACVAGLGLIQVPRVGVQHLLAEGRLVEVLAGYRAEPMPVSLIYPHRRHLPRRVKVFMDWIADLLAPHLEPLPSPGAPASR